MKKYKTALKPLTAWLLTICILLTSTTMGAAAMSLPSEERGGGIQVIAAPVSEAYKEYIRSGGQGMPVSAMDLSYLGESYAKQRARMRTNALLPRTYDLRDQGLVPPVGNQGIYGLCWTFAALGSAESGLIEQFPHISLSNVHLTWFSNYGKEEQEFNWYQYGDEEPDALDAGGYDQMAVGTMAAWKGPVSSSLVPYGKTTVDESLRYSADYHLQDAYYLPTGSFVHTTPDPPYAGRDTIKQIMMEGRAVSIGYAAGDQTHYYNAENAAFYRDTYSIADHAVLIAGWDDDYPKENFNETCRPKENGAWLIRNSWGVEWGDGGYFWLSYEDATIAYGCSYNLEAADNYTHNYQYDTLGWGNSTSVVDPEAEDSRSAYMSNIFTAEETEQLDAVSFYTTDAGAKYEISVYTGLTDQNDPSSGKKLTKTQTGTEPYAGYHTIELDEPVLVTKGEAFSVVVKLTNPEYPFPLPVEFCLMPSEKEEPEFMGNGGESYVSTDGETWIDAAHTDQVDEENATRYYIANVCLKAFTNPVSTVSFSRMEGPVALGTKLELSAPGADEIYYRVFRDEPQGAGSQAQGAAQKYTGPITIGENMKVQAWAVTDGAAGEVKEKIYTQAKSELSSLVLSQDSGITSLDISRLDGDTYSISTYVAKNSKKVRIQAQGTDTVTVNGKVITSGDWAEISMAAPGEITTINVRSEAAGNTPVEYTLRVYRSALSYDYRAETVVFDENLYQLTDQKGNAIGNGDSVTAYILEDGEAELILTRIADGETFTECVPARQVAFASTIDYINERTTSMYGDWNEVATKPDMSDAVKWEEDYIPLTPGQNVYIRKYATDIAFESKIVTIEVPDRPAMPEDPGVDYQTMMTKAAIPNTVTYAFTEDGSDIKMGTGEKIVLTSGTTLYLAVPPTDSSFASETREVTIAAAPAAPASPEAEQSTCASVILKTVPGAEYRLGSGDWQASPVFEGLEPETEYTFFIRIAATDSAPASDASAAVITTGNIPAVDPSDYSFEVKYVDIHGDPAPVGGTVVFDAVGKFSREGIPTPYGYQLVNIPENPGDEWLNPTGLEFIDGKWRVTNPVVTIEVEKQACVKIVFKTEDGTVLEDAGYEQYFGEIGAGVLCVYVPDGYELISDDQYAVDVTRDADGRLTADIAEAVFTVKQVGAEKPEEPTGSTDPTTPSKPGGKDIPQTGDSFPAWPLFTALLSFGGIALALAASKKRERTMK